MSRQGSDPGASNGRRGRHDTEWSYVASATNKAHDAVDHIERSAQVVSEQIASGVEQATKGGKG